MSQTEAQLIASNSVADGDIVGMSSSKLSGALPAISAAALTNIPASTTRTRNKVINGGMVIAQRGNVTNHGTSDTYTAVDRFCTRVGSSFNFDISSFQSSDSPDEFGNSLKISPDSTQTPSGGENGGIKTVFEGFDFQNFAFGTSSAKPMTLSFYAKSGSSGAGKYGIEVIAIGNGGTIQQTRAFTITSSWQRFTFTFEANGGATSSNIKNDNTKSFEIIWHLASGDSDKADPITTWQTATSMKSQTGMANFMSSTSNEFYLTGVQLEVGSTATDFEFRSRADEIAACQRYFVKQSGGSDVYIYAAKGQGSGSCDVGIKLNVPMRASPSITCSSNRFFRSTTSSFSSSSTNPSVVQFDSATVFSPVLAVNVSGHSSTNNEAGGWAPTGTELILDAEL